MGHGESPREADAFYDAAARTLIEPDDRFHPMWVRAPQMASALSK